MPIEHRKTGTVCDTEEEPKATEPAKIEDLERCQDKSALDIIKLNDNQK